MRRLVSAVLLGMAFLAVPLRGAAGTAHHGHSAEAPRVTVLSHGSSGSAWLPADTTMPGYMGRWGAWAWSAHGNLFLSASGQNLGNPDRRGEQEINAPNWIMAMAESAAFPGGVVLAKLMISLDPYTLGGDGYPLLYQTGETWEGQPLIDRQHPHDLIGELAVLYQHNLGPGLHAFAYVGYPGEPALGPPTYIHRPSAMPNPDAPLGHHWQDSTHISFGVATLGAVWGGVKAEGSLFTGREPDEHRANFDPPRLDSYAGRLSINPAPSLAFQVSYAYLRSPEEIHPGENPHRTTASLAHHARPGWGDALTTSLVWGANYREGRADHAYLVESSWSFPGWRPYARLERVEKSSEELALEPGGHAAETLYAISAATAGVGFDLFRAWGSVLSAGGHAVFFLQPQALEPVYGSNPFSLSLYLRLTPAETQH